MTYVSGDTIVAGASHKNGGGTNRGAAYVFARNYDPNNPGTPLADNWGQVKKLTASDGADYDIFGFSVAISGDTVIVGAPEKDGGGGSNRGAAYVFTRNQDGVDNWGQVEKLTAFDAADMDYFGRSVAISGDTAVVGAIYADVGGSNNGVAYVFARNQGGVGDSWDHLKKLTAADAADDDLFGRTVAISGDTIVIGADGEDGGGTDRGAAYLFARNKDGQDNWGQVRKLTAADAEDGDGFGISVAISNDTVVVEAYGKDGEGNDCGAAYVFERNQGGMDNWGQTEKLAASDMADEAWFGQSVSISDDTIIAGAYGKDDGPFSPDRGAACVSTLQQIYRIYLPLVANDN